MGLIVATQRASALSATVTFNTVGTADFTVPAGVTSLTIIATGGGGSGGGQNGGGGAIVTTTLAVTPGQVLDLFVGGSGAAPNWNAGGGGAGIGGAGGSGGSQAAGLPGGAGDGGNGGWYGGGGGGGGGGQQSGGGAGGSLGADNTTYATANNGGVGISPGPGTAGGNGSIAITYTEAPDDHTTHDNNLNDQTDDIDAALSGIEGKLDAQTHPVHPTIPDHSNLNATVSSRADQASVDAIEGKLDALATSVSYLATQGSVDKIEFELEQVAMNVELHVTDQTDVINSALSAIEVKLDTRLNATVSSRATQDSVDAIEAKADALEGKLDALQADVDLLTALVTVLFCEEADDDSALSIQLCPSDGGSNDDGSNDDD